MKKPPGTVEFAKFTAALSDILKVSKGEMQKRIETQKETGKRFSKGASLDPAVSSKLRGSVR